MKVREAQLLEGKGTKEREAQSGQPSAMLISLPLTTSCLLDSEHAVLNCTAATPTKWALLWIEQSPFPFYVPQCMMVGEVEFTTELSAGQFRACKMMFHVSLAELG